MVRIFVWSAILFCVCADNGTDFNQVFTYVDNNETVSECNDCISKCCPGTQIFLENICVENIYGKKLQDIEVDIYDKGISKTAYTLKKFNLVFSEVFNGPNAYFYEPEPNEKLYLLEDGNLISRRPNYLEQWGEPMTYKTFCMDLKISGVGAVEDIVYKQILDDYVGEADVMVKDNIAAGAMLVSCFFLLLVLAAYAVLPQKRNLPSLMLMAYVSCLATAFLFTAVHVFTEGGLTKLQCVSIGLTVYYTLLASFTWLNVMSYDMWSTTCKSLSPRWEPRCRILAKFCWYSLYGFGAPLLTTIFLVLIDYADLTEVPDFVKPHFVFGAEGSCYFESENERRLYVNAAILVATVINIFFFVLTGTYIWRHSVKPGGSGESRNTKKDQSRFIIYLKLTLIMGVNWILDVLSAFISSDSWVWYLSDVFNSLIGLFIFMIFVCKRDMILLLCKRFSIKTRFAQQWESTVDSSVYISKRQLSDKESGSTNIIPEGFSEKPKAEEFAKMTQSPKKYVSTFTSSTTNRGVEAKEIEIANIQLDSSSQYQESDVELRSQASAEEFAKMTQSPKKYVSTFTSSTTNRGVEAKEIEIANIQLDSSSQYQESDVELRSQASGDTGSYLQVVVQKHKKKEPITAATQTSPRRPVASSPIKAPKNGSGDTQLYVLQQPMLLAYPNTQNTEKHDRKKLPTVKEECSRSFWSKFKEATKENSPDKVDLYYFERTNGEYLATSDGTYTYTESFAQQISRIPNRIVAEMFSIPQIIAGMPVAIILNGERSVLIIFRSLLVGSVQIWSDYFLKPILTLVFNAIIQPPLVFVGNIGRGLREAARPLAQIIGDFLEPVVKVLSAIRLVNIDKNGSHNV